MILVLLLTTYHVTGGWNGVSYIVDINDYVIKLIDKFIAIADICIAAVFIALKRLSCLVDYDGSENVVISLRD